MNDAAAEVGVAAAAVEKRPAPAPAAPNRPPPALTIPSYRDPNDGSLRYPALESTHRHFVARGVFHIWRCCRCTSRTAVHSNKCAGGVCGHRRCEWGCTWLTMGGSGFEGLVVGGGKALLRGRGHEGGVVGGVVPEEEEEGEEEEEASSSSPSPPALQNTAASNHGNNTTTAAAAADETQQLPSPPDEQRRHEGATIAGIASAPQQRQHYWICCACGEGRNRTAETGCRVGMCGHERGPCCGACWVDDDG